MTLAAPIDARVDGDLAAYRRGPAELDARMASLPAAEVLARYRLLIARVELKRALRTKEASTSLLRAELADERRQILKGGNR